GFTGNVDDERDRALPLDMNGDGKDDFLWYRPGTGFAGVHLSTENDGLSYVPFSNSSQRFNGFRGDVADARDSAIAVNLTGGSRSSFIWYRTGGGAFEAYTASGLTASQFTLMRTAYFGRIEYWMEDLAYFIGKIPMKGIVIPGTHDAAMYPGMTDID